MKSSILIDVEARMTSVSLIEDGKLNEFHIEYKETNRLTGNIYKGKVENVLQGLESAFVNIGRARNGFLYVGETLDDRDLKRVVPSAIAEQAGDFLMVQVTKEEVGQKGARLTSNISLPGRNIVYLPNIDFVGISGKITDPERREKLTKLLTKYKPRGGGLIARTACMDAKKNDIVAEIKRMQALYENIRAAYDSAEGVSLLHSEDDLVYRAIRDMLHSEVETIVCNDENTADRVREMLRQMNSDFCNKVELYKSNFDMWDTYGIGDEVDKLLERKVALPSGGTLYIDRTEALTAIDVNTGSFTSGADREETVFLANMEAASEIARQLRLRNIGGIIVVDFIDMLNEEHKTQVVEALRDATVRDRIKTRVHDMTQLGLVGMTRKKVGKPLFTKLLDRCEHCGSLGYVPNSDYVARKLKAAIKKLFAQQNCQNALVVMNSSMVEKMFASRYFSTICEGEWRNKRIYLIPNPQVMPLEFQILGNDDAFITLPPASRLLY